MRSIPRTRRRLGRPRRWAGTLAVVASSALVRAPAAAAKQGNHGEQGNHGSHGGRAIGHYGQHNLVSDQAGMAELTDPNLVNAWGLTFGPTTPAWASDNGTDVSPLYNGGVAGSPVAKVAITVNIPGGAPTGAVFNANPEAFMVHSGADSGPARFLVSSEAGMITGWNPAVPPPPISMDAQT